MLLMLQQLKRADHVTDKPNISITWKKKDSPYIANFLLNFLAKE